MSFFNKMLSFTEWHNTADQLDEAIKANEKYQESYNRSISDSYIEFVRKQPLEINDYLFKINDKQKLLEEPCKGEYACTKELRKDIEKLRPLNDDIKKKRKEFEKFKLQTEKSAKASEKADQKLASVRAAGTDTPEFKKAEDNAEICRRQKETDQANFEERDRAIKVDEKEYKKQFFQQLLQSIGTYATKRSELSKSQIQIGEEICDYGRQIPFYEDASVEKLQTRLQALRAEPFE